VDRDPSVKRFSGTIDMKEQKQTFQGQDYSAVMDRKDGLMEWLMYLKIIQKAPNYMHDHKIICTYNKIFSPDHGGPPNQNSKLWHSINDIANISHQEHSKDHP
jgi:hypothetical protein